MATKAAIGLIVAALIVLIGVRAFIVVCLPALLLAALMGVWLFYVQHQFEEMTWRAGESWSLHGAALHGSSHYDLPTVLRWITANIGIHHVHHLCSRIRYYRLPQVLRDYPELGPIDRLTLRERKPALPHGWHLARALMHLRSFPVLSRRGHIKDATPIL